jgi:hypothetical protein
VAAVSRSRPLTEIGQSPREKSVRAGASYTFTKIDGESIPPVTLIAARTLMAGAILLGVIRSRGLALPRDVAIWRRFLFRACLNSMIPCTLIAWAERAVDAGLAGADCAK